MTDLVIDLPNQGDVPWGDKLNAAILAIVARVNLNEAEVHPQATPLATWTFSHTLGRIPNVQIYLGSELVLAPVDATASSVTVTFPAPKTGTLILT